MKDNIQKTFSDSYVFNYDKNGTGKSIAKEIRRKLVEFILSSDRLVDKKSPSFIGIREEVKRQQTSSLIYSVLMRNDVVLCINSVELPRAFKVFEAVDIKEGKGTKKIFIDISGLVTFNNGYYSCKNIFTLITYLNDAVTYLLYRNDPIKFLNNANISISATECYVRCFSFVLDYLRLPGFAENRAKIQYLTGLFFLNNLMGKDIDNYSKNLSAKIAGIGPNEIRAYELYYDEEDFESINTFLAMLMKNFKLDGLSTELFITRWVYHFQKGTEYAIDLFTSFLVMITSAYCGTYIVNQKQIEKCCGRSMVKLSTSILELGANTLDKSMYSENAGEFGEYHTKETVTLAEGIASRGTLPEYAKLIKEDCGSKELAKTKVKNMVKRYLSSQQEAKISPRVVAYSNIAMKAMDKSKVTDNYEIGVLEVVINEGKKYLNNKDKRTLINEIEHNISILTDAIKKDKVRVNKDLSKKIALELSELRKCENKIA